MFNTFLMFFMLFFVLGFVVFVWGCWSGINGFLSLREQSSSFECGFDGKDKGRLSFSLRFFVVVMLFIVFDMELCYMLKFPYYGSEHFYQGFFMFAVFLLVVLLGTLEEWRRGILIWKLG